MTKLISLGAIALALASSLTAQTPACARTGSAVAIQAARDTTVACVLKSGAVTYKVSVTPAKPAIVPTPTPPAAPIPVPVPTPTPPLAQTPPSNPGVCANEPAGFTRIEDQPWNTAVPSKWVDDARDFIGSGKGTIVSDPTAPLSPSSVVAGLFPNGSPGGSGPFYIYRPFAATEQYKNLYLCIAVKWSADFDNTNGNAGTKFLWPAGDQIQGNATYITLNGPSMDLGVNQQGGATNPAKPGVQDNREMYANVGSATVASLAQYRGRWVAIEVLLKGNSSNSTFDGGLSAWVNGTPTHVYTNVNWQMDYFGQGLAAAQRKWLSLAWNPTYGGGLSPVPHNQYEYIDHLRISGK